MKKKKKRRKYEEDEDYVEWSKKEYHHYYYPDREKWVYWSDYVELRWEMVGHVGRNVGWLDRMIDSH